MKLERFVETWGTVIVVQVASRSLNEHELGLAVDKVEEFFHKVDKDFSTYKSDSEVFRIRRGELEVADASDDVRKVWQLCEHARELTLGAFDPLKVEGGVPIYRPAVILVTVVAIPPLPTTSDI